MPKMSAEENKFASLYNKLDGKIVGREKEIRTILAALAAGRHIILEGPPGTSKSTILKAIAEESGVPFYMIMGNTDLTSTKLLGYFDPARALAEGYKPENYEYGPLSRAMIEGALLYIEEFNRMPEDATNVLVTAMSEGELSIPRVGMIKARPTFRIIAAMNPYDDIGTSKVSRAIRDRFCSIKMNYQTKEEEMQIVKLKTGNQNDKIIAIAVEVARRTRNHPDVRLGASVRGAIDMVLISEKLLDMNKNPQKMSTNELFLEAAITAMRDKIWLLETSERTPEDIIKEIWDKVNVEENASVIKKNSMEKTNTSADSQTADKSEVSTNDDVGLDIPSEEEPQTIDIHELDTARSNSKNTSQMLGKQRTLFYQWLKTGDEEANNVLELGWDKLDPETKKMLTDLIIRMILKISRSLEISRGVRIGEPKPSPYRFNSDELDLDGTIEKITAKICPEYDDFVVLERQPLKRACVLMLDCSGSMRGQKIMQAALATATLAMSLRKDEYAVLMFSEKSNLLKALNQTKPVQHVIDKILNAKAEGCTDIYQGLELGLDELHKATAQERSGILISDGWQNMGEDPITIAKRYPKLHVIGLPGGDSKVCRNLASAGKGKCIFVKELSEIPDALKVCLSD